MRQQQAGLRPPADSSSLKVSQIQGHLLPSQTRWFSAQGLGLGAGVVQSHQWASPLQLSGKGGPRAGPLDSLTPVVVPRRPLNGFAESKHVIQR